MNVVKNLIKVAMIFFRKSLQAQIDFFAVWLLISFQVQFISFVKRKAKFTIEQWKPKGQEERV